MGPFGIGQAVTREEDPRLLVGDGRYVNDHNLPGQAHAYLRRAPHAHAEIVSMDPAAAAAAPGVAAVYPGDDVAADGIGAPIPAPGSAAGASVSPSAGSSAAGSSAACSAGGSSANPAVAASAVAASSAVG